ncbi:MAG: hypothetical protein LBE09_03430 [Christensenellaceae bacterium]|nr:hypothetical protein [Christensenellaceae bacterium]
MILRIAVLLKTSVDYVIGLSNNSESTHSVYKSLSAFEIKANLADRLIKVRHNHNGKTNALVVALDLHDRTIHVYRDRTRPMMPSYETLIKIAKRYGCSAESLLR